jgi:hypothetical protein
MTRLLLIFLLCGSALGQNITNAYAGMKVWAGVQLTTVASDYGGGSSEMVVNGGFETGDFTGWGQSNVVHTSVNDLVPRSGIYSLEIYGTPSEYISQTLTTLAGTNYTLSFWLWDNGNQPMTMGVLWDNTIVTNMSFADSYFDWTQFSFSLTASNVSTPLRFVSGGSYGVLWLDDVSVTKQ